MAKRTDPLIRFLLPEAHARGAIIRGRNIVADGRRIHGLNQAPGELFGQALLASILLLSINKGGLRQVLQLDALPSSAHAPLQRIMAETRRGSVRGSLDWRQDKLAMRNRRHGGVSCWMGKAIRLSTVRDMGVGQPYISTIEHESDFLADHIAHYLNQSVQTRADIILRGDLGLMIEAMPGCDETCWFKAVEAVAVIPDSALAADSPEQILTRLDGLRCKPGSRDEYAYSCDCSAEKMAHAIKGLPAGQLRELADAHGRITISCQYCNRHYQESIAEP
jgi:redox-regulated HSP33 family molecular chaperone